MIQLHVTSIILTINGRSGPTPPVHRGCRGPPGEHLLTLREVDAKVYGFGKRERLLRVDRALCLAPNGTDPAVTAHGRTPPGRSPAEG